MANEDTFGTRLIRSFTQNRFIKGGLSWVPGYNKRIEPELFSQGRKITMDRYGLRAKASGGAGGQFAEYGDEYSAMAIYRPSGGKRVDAAKAMSNAVGWPYVAGKAIAREVMNIDFRLFQISGKDHKEKEEHDILDLLDTVNPDMTGSELKYLTSFHLDLTGNAYWLMTGVKDEKGKPNALYMLDPSRVRVMVDQRDFPFQVTGYKVRFNTFTKYYQPWEVLHFREPDPLDPYEGVGPVQNVAEWIDLDNYAMEFNRRFFVNGARPAGFLISDTVVNEAQIENIKISFADVHGGIDNMNRIAVLPKGLKWQASGTSPKDMDFSNLSDNTRDRILSAFGVSKTILGTAESDTNRATAETADYVFSKRVVRPRMQLICDFLNQRLVGRYGDDLYITFIDPVPEDRAARVTEMQAAIGSQPVLTVDEARDEYMGLGPVDGGDKLMVPNTVTAAGEKPPAPEPAPAAGKKPPQSDTEKEEQEEQEEDGKKGKQVKTASGARVAFRPARARMKTITVKRKEMASETARMIEAALAKALAKPTSRFAPDEKKDAAAFESFKEQAAAAEKAIHAIILEVNAKQRKEVLENLAEATGKNAEKLMRAGVETKAVDPTKLFDLDNWITFTTDALTPTIEKFFAAAGTAAAAELGFSDINPLTNNAAKVALHRSVALMSESYNTTTLAVLEEKLNEGITGGASLADLTKTVGDVFDVNDKYSAERISKTEAFRTMNEAQKVAWKQTGVVKTMRWYTSEMDNVCPFCAEMNGKSVSIDDNFFDQGETYTVGDQSMSVDYSDISAPPLHPNCNCFIRPDELTD